MKLALNVGCGNSSRENTHDLIKGPEWQHIRIDIDPKVQPDLIDDIRYLAKVGDESVDAIFSSHNLEHLHEYDAQAALRTFYRKLKSGGLCIIIVPDLAAACRQIAEGKMGVLYESPAGSVRAIDMLYGYAPYSYGNEYQFHRFGYTEETLFELITNAGFTNVKSAVDETYNVWGFGQKLRS